MVTPTQEERMIQRFLDVMRVADRDTVTPEEVTQAIEIILGLIQEGYLRTADEIQDARSAAEKGTEELERKYRATRKKTNAKLDSLKGLIDTLLAWKKSQEEESEESTVAQDARAALDMAEETAGLLGELRARVDGWKHRHGKPGKNGKMPAHEWDGTSLRFENPDGSWGERVDLKGDPGHGGGFFSGWGSSSNTGVQSITAGSNITITGTRENPIINSTGGGGSTQTIEEPVGTINDTNLDFTFTEEPFLIVMNERTYRKGGPAGWTWNAGTLTATMPSAVGDGGDIYGIMQ